MPRQARGEEAGAIHHAVPQGNNRRPIVMDDHDRRGLVGRLGEVAVTCGWEVLAYGLMDTHLHVVVRTREPNLGAGMQCVLGWYAYRFNARHGREGSVFAPKFFSQRIVSEEHLVRAVLYASLNPVAAGVCEHPEAYQWCSYRATAGLTRGSRFVSREWLTEIFHGDLDTAGHRYRELVTACSERVVARRAAAREEIDEIARRAARPVASD
jgi:REP element-mobilizing transposase RayT